MRRSRPRLPPHRRGQERQRRCVANVPSRWRLRPMEPMPHLQRRTTRLRLPSPYVNVRWWLLLRTSKRHSPVSRRRLPSQRQLNRPRYRPQRHPWGSPRTHHDPCRFHKMRAKMGARLTPIEPKAMSRAAVADVTAAVVAAKVQWVPATTRLAHSKTWLWPAMSAWMKTTRP